MGRSLGPDGFHNVRKQQKLKKGPIYLRVRYGQDDQGAEGSTLRFEETVETLFSPFLCILFLSKGLLLFRCAFTMHLRKRFGTFCLKRGKAFPAFQILFDRITLLPIRSSGGGYFFRISSPSQLVTSHVFVNLEVLGGWRKDFRKLARAGNHIRDRMVVTT